MKNQDTTAMDRRVLNGTKGITEALYRYCHLSDEAARDAQEVRKEVGAKPLRLKREESRRLDESTRTPTAELKAEDIKALRTREGASQASLAKRLGVATATVGQWERGQRRPDGAATKLLSLVQAKGLDYIR